MRSGSLLLLVRIKATALTTATGVGMWVYLGDNESPAACDDKLDEVCGNHLDGAGSAAIQAQLAHRRSCRRQQHRRSLRRWPGYSLASSLRSPTARPSRSSSLAAARAIATLGETTLTNGILAGAITDADLQNEVLPAVHAGITSSVDDDCTGTVPNCCDDGSTGATIVGLVRRRPSRLQG